MRGYYGLNNLFGQADRLDLNLIMTFNPQNSIYYDAAYEQPIWNYDFLVGGGVSINEFDVGGNLEDLGINGSSTIISSHMTWLMSRKRTERISFTGDLSIKNVESKIVASEDKLTVLSATAAYQGTSWSSSSAYQQ